MEKNEIIEKIWSLKINLQDTDYQIVKCYEASLLNESLPYNLQELLQKRKTWREEINNLEFELSMLG